MSRALVRGLFAQVEAYFTEYLPANGVPAFTTIRLPRCADVAVPEFVAGQRGADVASPAGERYRRRRSDALSRSHRTERSNSAATRNCRRAAIHAFLQASASQ